MTAARSIPDSTGLSLHGVVYRPPASHPQALGGAPASVSMEQPRLTELHPVLFVLLQPRRAVSPAERSSKRCIARIRATCSARRLRSCGGRLVVGSAMSVLLGDEWNAYPMCSLIVNGAHLRRQATSA